MPRRRFLKARSSLEWTVRGILAVSCAAIGIVSVAHTLADSIKGTDPERAHALSPGDGSITAALAQQRLGTHPSPDDRVRAARLARAALLQDPTVAGAVSTLGLATQLDGNGGAAKRLFSYAQRLSRRDLQTQLWAVEDAVGRGDVPAALHHYDIALRTTRTAPDLLFPIMSSAIADPTVRKGLVKTLAGKPDWRAGFIDYAADNGPSPQATASFLLSLHRAHIPVSERASAAIISTLISRSMINDAWIYYSIIRPGVDRRTSRDPRFTTYLSNPTPFDWVPVSDEIGVLATIQPARKGGMVDLSAPTSVGGALLRQMEFLPPGAYILTGHSNAIEQPQGSGPYWTLTCHDGHELGRLDMPNSTSGNGWFTGTFVVPTGCPFQMLALIARPSDAVTGFSGQVDQAGLAPAP